MELCPGGGGLESGHRTSNGYLGEGAGGLPHVGSSEQQVARGMVPPFLVLLLLLLLQ